MIKEKQDNRFLMAVRAAIAIKNIPKKKLARRCRVSKARFSEFIHGDRPMPHEVRERLIKELGLEKVLLSCEITFDSCPVQR